MFYAKVVLALPVEGPFDYQIPKECGEKISPGTRAWVNFRGKKEICYITGISAHSEILKVKPLIRILDNFPVLSPQMLSLSRMLADYYCCSWGEAIAACLPEPLRKGKSSVPVTKNVTGTLGIKNVTGTSGIEGSEELRVLAEKEGLSGLLLTDLGGEKRWDFYCREVKEVLALGKSALILAPDKAAAALAGQLLARKIQAPVETFFRQQPDELMQWEKIRNSGVKVVVGTRSSIFAPLPNLGLIIVDEESDSVYKQEQSPHYHARTAALMRARLEKAKIILCATAVSLESVYLARQNKIVFQVLERGGQYPEVKIIDMKNLPLLDRKKNVILSRLLQDNIVSVLAGQGKILLFLNRKGFATSAVCSSCGQALKCPRCNLNLVYFSDNNILSCHYCNYKLVPPKICPQCDAGYIKFSGAGTEKIEAELLRIFPKARIKRIDAGEIPNKEEADIFVATQGIIRHAGFRFDLTAVLAIDNSLNHVDFRSSEKVFAILLGLLALTDKQMFIQTSLPGHYCFQAVEKNDIDYFYDEELKSRRQVKFPPFRHFCQVKIRGRDEQKALLAGEKLFQQLSGGLVPKDAQIISLNPGYPPKLRGNYCWVILISSSNVLSLNEFLKNCLKNFRSSGIIVTVDVDPV